MTVTLRAPGPGTLRLAMLATRTIRAAVGVVRACRLVTEAGAFALLVRASQDSNRRIRLLARDLVDTGDLAVLPRKVSGSDRR